MLALSVPAGGGGGYAFTGAHAAASSTAGNSITTANINTLSPHADLLVVVVSAYSNAPTISDSQSNTWTSAVTNNFYPLYTNIFFVQAPSVSATHNFTSVGSGSYSSLCVAAFTGSVASPLDQTNSATGAGPPISPGSITPTQSNQLIIAGVGTRDTATSGYSCSGFTIIDVLSWNSNAEGSGLAYLVQGAAAAINPTWNWTGSVPGAVAAIASFKHP